MLPSLSIYCTRLCCVAAGLALIVGARLSCRFIRNILCSGRSQDSGYKAKMKIVIVALGKGIVMKNLMEVAFHYLDLKMTCYVSTFQSFLL